MRSLRLRLTVLFAVVTSLSIAAVGLFLDYSLSRQLKVRTHEELAGKAELFGHVLSGMRAPAEVSANENRFAEVLIGHGGLKAAIFDITGRPVLELGSFPWPAALIDAAALGLQAEGAASLDGMPYRVLVSQVQTRDAPVLVGFAQDVSESHQIVAGFRATIVLAVLLASLLAGALGYFAAVRGLHPLQVVSRAAARVSAERLHERLELADVPRELRDLAEGFNGMLDRLQDSFQRLSEFSADLAHELRTPLTNLTLQAQVALDRPRNEAHLRGVLESGLEELERLTRMVNDMLFLAKADYAQLHLDLQPLMLEDEVDKILEYFEAVAADRGVRVERHGAATVQADRAMIRRALANLVSNAIRYADPGSTALVRLRNERGAAVAEVENRGPALSDADRLRVFDRFYRAETSRASQGTGLGLAIVKSIVELHGGAVSATSDGRRTVFRIALQRS